MTMTKLDLKSIEKNINMSLQRVFKNSPTITLPKLNDYAFSQVEITLENTKIKLTVTDTSPDSFGPFRGSYNWNLELSVYNPSYDPQVKERTYSGQTILDIRMEEYLPLMSLINKSGDFKNNKETDAESVDQLQELFQTLKEYLER